MGKFGILQCDSPLFEYIIIMQCIDYALRSPLNRLMCSSLFFPETTKFWSAERTLLHFSKISRACRQVKLANTIVTIVLHTCVAKNE